MTVPPSETVSPETRGMMETDVAPATLAVESIERKLVSKTTKFPLRLVAEAIDTLPSVSTVMYPAPVLMAPALVLFAKFTPTELFNAAFPPLVLINALTVIKPAADTDKLPPPARLIWPRLTAQLNVLEWVKRLMLPPPEVLT